jgi:serine/threonine-protein kinase HipA
MTKKLIVYLTHSSQPQKIGTFAQKDRKIYFEYDKAFLQTGIELSPYKLPLKSGLHIGDNTIFDGLWGVFNDSLPDGWGRLLMDRHLMRLGIQAAALTPLDRLSYIGHYGMGALSYESVREVASSLLDEVVLDDLAGHSQEILEGSSDLLIDELLALNGSSAGARPKVMVQIDARHKQIIHGQQSLCEGFGHWMVKFASSNDSQEVGAIEYAYSLMAKAAKLDMPETALLEGKRGRYFACKRFDREGDKRIHMHSVAGLVHSDFRYPSLDYDDLLSLTLHLTKDVQEQEKMFRLACFNLLTHNRDDHAKNFSFLMDDRGVWRLAPAYDLTFSSGPGGEHSTMYLGEGRHPTIGHLMNLGKKHGLKKSVQMIDEVQAAVGAWRQFAKESGVSVQMARGIERGMKNEK